jgi:hypothetical protein
MTTDKTSLKLKMPAKKILWGVSPAIKEKDGSEFFNEIDRFVSTEIEDISINGDVLLEIRVNSIPARKDTKLLDLSWGKDILKNKWDQSHLNALTLDEDENKRCGVIGIQLLNKYYGGTLTQDEIKFYVGFSINEPLLSPFMHTGLSTEELNKGLKWALNTEKLNYNLGSPSYEVVKKAIDGGRLILVTVVLTRNLDKNGKANKVYITKQGMTLWQKKTNREERNVAA